MIDVRAEIARLVERYSANQQHVVALRERLRDLFAQARRLQAAVEVDRLAFSVAGSMYLLEGGSESVPQDFAGELPELMRELQGALLEEQRLGEALTRAGLGGLVG